MRGQAGTLHYSSAAGLKRKMFATLPIYSRDTIFFIDVVHMSSEWLTYLAIFVKLSGKSSATIGAICNRVM